MNTGEKIKSYRTQLNMSQNKLSQITGISESAIRKYEKGERIPKIEQLQKISDAFDISILVFIDDNDFYNEGPLSPAEKMIVSDITAWVESYMEKISDSTDHRLLIVNILTNLRAISRINDQKKEGELMKSINDFIGFTLSSNSINYDDSSLYREPIKEGE